MIAFNNIYLFDIYFLRLDINNFSKNKLSNLPGIILYIIKNIIIIKNFYSFIYKNVHIIFKNEKSKIDKIKTKT